MFSMTLTPFWSRVDLTIILELLVTVTDRDIYASEHGRAFVSSCERPRGMRSTTTIVIKTCFAISHGASDACEIVRMTAPSSDEN